MHLLKHESPSGGEHLHLPPDVLADALGRAVRKLPLGIAPSAPEDHPVAEIRLESARFHPAARDLDRIDGIQSRVDKVGE